MVSGSAEPSARIAVEHPDLSHVKVMIFNAGMGRSRSVSTIVDGLTNRHAIVDPLRGMLRVDAPVVVAEPDTLDALRRLWIRMPALGAGSNAYSKWPSQLKPKPARWKFSVPPVIDISPQ